MAKDSPNKPSVAAHIKDSSLNYAGMGYLIGDAALFAHGMMNRDYAGAFTGLSWGVGGLVTALYGKETPEHQLARVAHNLAEYLQKNNIEIPQDSELQQQFLSKRSTIWSHLEDFLYKHPSQVLNATYAIGGASLMRSSLAPSAQAIAKGKMQDNWAAASGMLVSTGALLGLMLPEESAQTKLDAKTPHKQPVQFKDNPIQWFNDKPLRWPSLFYTINNATLLKSAFDEHKANQNPAYMLKYLAVCTYLVSNSLLGLSSKDQATQSGSQIPVDTLEALAAQIIAAQPQEMQDILIHNVSGFLAKKPEVNHSAQELAIAIAKHVQERSTNPTLVAQAQWDGKLREHSVQPTR